MTAATFNLHALTREVVREHPSADPARIAETLLDRIPRQAYRRVLALLLRRYVLDVVRAQRTTAPPTRPAPTPIREPSAGRSWKREGIVTDWRRQRLAGVDLEHKYLADCTYDDLVAAAQRRRDHAKATLHQADRYDALAALITKHGAAKLGEVPDADVLAVLERAA